MTAPFITSHDLRSLLEAKANLIRYELADPAAGTLSDLGYKAWVSSHMDHVKNVVAPLLQEFQAKMVFDIHTPPGGVDVTGKLPVFRMFTDRAWARETLKDVCKTVTTAYKGVDFVRAIEPMNEPHGTASDIISIYKECLTEIRKIDRDKSVIVSTPYGHPNTVKDLILYPFRRVWYTIHMYTPLTLTHQGVYDYPVGPTYPSETYDKSKMIKTLKPIREFQKKTGVNIFIGEFSCSNFTDETSRYRYLRDCISLFEQYGFQWTYHAWFGESNIWVPTGRVLELLKNRWNKNS